MARAQIFAFTNQIAASLRQWFTASWFSGTRNRPAPELSLPSPGNLSRAAAQGADISRLAELAAQELLDVARADRAGVWFRSAGEPHVLRGVLLDASGAPVPESWTRLDTSMAYFETLLAHHEPVLAHLDGSSGVTPLGELEEAVLGPLEGMNTAVWLPLRLGARALGLAVIGFRDTRREMDFERLAAVGAEAAVAAAARLETQALDGLFSEQRAQEKLRRAIESGAPAGDVLREIARGAQRAARASFVGLAMPESSPFEYRILEGSSELATSASAEAVTAAWKRAALSRSVQIHHAAETSTTGWPRRPRDREGEGRTIAFVLAWPLQAWFDPPEEWRAGHGRQDGGTNPASPLGQGELLGLLIAGFPLGADPAEARAQLEPYATLAVAALREERIRTLLAGTDQRFRDLLDSSPGSLLVVDSQGRIREANRELAALLGLSSANTGRERFEELLVPEARGKFEEWLVRSREAGERAPRNDRGARATPVIEAQLKSGQQVRVSFRGRIRRGPPSRSIGTEPAACSGGIYPASLSDEWLLCLEDRSGLREVEGVRGKAEAELLALLDSVDSGILLFDNEGRLRLSNDRFAQLLGLDANALAERSNFESLVLAVADRFRDPAAFARRWREAAAALRSPQGEAMWDELEVLRPSRRVLERFARPVVDAEGLSVGWLEVYRDITGQRLIQSKLLQTEKMAALGQLVSGIAHELNNPLASIMGYAQLLLARLGSGRGQLRSEAERIFQEAERSARIVKNLLLFSRETKPERRPVDLNEVVERALALRSYELKIENISLELQLDPDLPPVAGDAHQLQQVALNLIVNAEQAIQIAGHERGHISVRTLQLGSGQAHRPGPKRVALEVADDGPGIPPEMVSRVFDPFFTTKPVGVGTGLGLSIVYGIVQEHGGEIYVESASPQSSGAGETAGHGARFVVELPVGEEVTVPDSAWPAPKAAETKPAAGEAGSAQVRATRPERILIVEDEPTVAQLVSDVLREEGFHTDVILDSQEGLNRLAQQRYDLVVCDLRMPRLDGQAFYQALVNSGSLLPAGAQPRNSDAAPVLVQRILFITGDTLTRRTLEFLERNHLPYLSKPFLVEELKLSVAKVLGRSAAPPSGNSEPAGGETGPSQPSNGRPGNGRAQPASFVSPPDSSVGARRKKSEVRSR